MSYIHHKPFKKTFLTTALTLATATTAQASIVSDGIDYQYFRDFAENKGKFTVGATQIDVTDKAGATKQMFPDGQASMLDLAVTSTNGVAHLIDPQYIASVKHNVGYGNVHFGLQRSSNFAEPNYDYLLVARNDKPNSGENGNWTMKDDYHIPRLHKLVTEVAPIPILRLKHEDLKLLADRTRFPYIVRTGAGTQRVRPLDGSEDKDVAGAYNYVVGGNIMNNVIVQTGNNNRIFYIYEDRLDKTVTDSQYGPLPTISMGGDSGSPVFAYDAQEKQWVAISVHHGGNRSSRNWTIFHQPEFIDELIAKDIVVIDNTIADPNVRLNWLVNTNTSTITSTHDRELRHTVNLRDETLAKPDETRFRDDLNHGKSIRITGNQGNLRLGSDVHQGAGALYFDTDFTVFGARDDLTWVGAGVSVADGKTVNWRVHNPEGDRLSKIGAGTLNVTGVGVNKGKISVGEGTVLLNQRANAQGEKQAFSEVQITSGRPTVVLGDDKQVNPDNIVFGFRGGRLDVNGNDLTFTRLRSVDSGAKIVNHNPNDGAVVTFNQSLVGSEPISPSDVVIETDRSSTYRPKGIYKNGPYRDDGRTDYYILKDGANPSTFLPGKGQDNSAWEFISTDENEAKRIFAERENARRKAGQIAFFEGQLGETDTQRHNGNLDFVYNPQNQVGRLVLNGGTNLNGTLSVAGGTLILSGNPVPHAYDYLNKTDVVKDDEWVNSNFTAKNFNITNGTLLTSRNVDTITGNINVSQTGQAHLGFANGETDVCYRSDFSGVAHCSNRAIDNLITPLTINGDITTRNQAKLSTLNTTVNGELNAFDQSTVTLKNNTIVGKGINLNNTAKLTFANSEPLTVKVSGTRNSQVAMKAGSHWQLPQNTTIGQLMGEAGSQITLSDEKTNQFQTLTLNGDLSGQVRFNVASDLGEGKADKLVVNGYAEGQHQIAVRNTGNEANVDKLTLVELKHGGQVRSDVTFGLVGGEVHAGSLRYALESDASNRYFLYNPTKADELKKQREAEANKAKADEEKAKQELAEAILARQKAEQAQKDAEEALKQALANGGASAQTLLEVQRQLEEARRLADEAQAGKERAEAQLAQKTTELANAEKAKMQADEQIKAVEAQKLALQTQLDTANHQKAEAEQAKVEAEQALNQANQQALTAQSQKTQAEQQRDEALAKQQEAEAQKTAAETQLAEANRLKALAQQALLDAQANGGKALLDAQQALDEAKKQIADKEQELATAKATLTQAQAQKTQAEQQAHEAHTALTKAQADLANANEAKNQAIAQAERAETAKQTAEQKLDETTVALTKAQADKASAEQQAHEAQVAKARAEEIQKNLEQAQTAQAQALKEAEQALALAQQAKNQALTDKQSADVAKQQAQDARDKALNDLATAEQQKAQALADLTTAQREKQQLEEALQLAQATNQDVADLQKRLTEANAEVAQKTTQLQQAVATQSALQQDLDSKEQALNQANQQLAQTQADKAQAQDEARRQAELARQATLAKQTAENAQQLAQQSLAQAEQIKNQALADLANTQLAKEKAEQAQAQAQTAEKLAQTARETAEQALQVALTDKQKAENDKTQAQADLAIAQREKQQLEEALQLAQQNGNQNLTDLQNQLAQANQTIHDKERALAQAEQDKQQAQTAEQLAKNQRDTALATAQTAEQAKQQAQTALADIRTQLAKAQAEKQSADLAKAQAQTAQTQAEQNLANALREKQKADDDLAKIQRDLTALQTQKDQLQLDLTQANADKVKIQADLANAILAKETAEDALRLATQTNLADVAKLTQDLADANAQILQKTEELKQAIANQATLQTELNSKEKALTQAQADKTKAEQDKQTADLARIQAQTAQKLAEAEQARQAELTKTAQNAQKVAELTAQNAQIAQKLAEQAKEDAQIARQKAEEANTALSKANERLKAATDADAKTLVQAQTDLANAQQLVDSTHQKLSMIEQDLATKQAQLAQIHEQNRVIEAQLQQERTLREQAQLAQQTAQNAQKLAEQATKEAIQAQHKSDAEKQEAQTKADEAEQFAKQKQLEADEAEQARALIAKQLEQTLAQVQTQATQLAKAEADSELAKAQAKEAEQQQKLAEAEAERLRALTAQKEAEERAKEARQQKQADVISQYANTALSELSAQAHHLHRVGDRIDDRLQRLNGENSGFWLQTDNEKTKHASEQYRDYKQDSQLTQIGVDNTIKLSNSSLTVGGALNHLRYDADYADDFQGEGRTVTGTVYGKWHTPSGFAISGDVTAGQTDSQISQHTRTNNIDRTVVAVGVGASQSFHVGDIDIEAHAGVRRYLLGDAKYNITASDGSQTKVTQDDIGIVSYQTGVNVGKTIKTTGGVNVRPSVGVSYRHTNSEATIAINNQPLTQKFANEVQTQVAIGIGKDNWELNLQADYAKNNESGNRTGALVGLNWQW